MLSTVSLLQTALPLALAVIMFGLGLTLTRDDFLRLARFPKAIALGLMTQMIFIPIAGFLLCRVFHLPTDLALGLMLLAASPGGVTANIFSHLAGGDVALNLTLTALNSILAALTLPLIMAIAIRMFSSRDQQVELHFSKALEVFSIVLIPVGVGLFLNQKFPRFARRAESPLRAFSILVLIGLVMMAVIQNGPLFQEYFGQLALIVTLFNLFSLALGFGLPTLLRLPRREAIAIAMEVGIHNSTLAMALAVSIFGSLNYAMPAAFYSVIMFMTAGLFSILLKKGVFFTP